MTKCLVTNYSQTREKCSRPISSLRGLQGQKNLANAIIKILILTKSIIGKNCHDQLFINEVVKFFTFQFGESVTKFYVVKVLLILMKFLYALVKYHKKKFWCEREKKNYFNPFSKRKKKLKNGHLWPPLHKSKLIFHAYELFIQNFYEFTNSNKLQ